MTELRWILLIIGGAIVALVYLWGRRAPAPNRDAVEHERRPPSLGDVGQSAVSGSVASDRVTPDPVMETDVPAEKAPQSAPTPADKLVILHMVCGDENEFDATELVGAIRAEGLRFGRFDIFHRFSEKDNPGPDSQPVFSVANMVKPGVFQLDKLRDTTIRGISLFVQIPGPPDPIAAFADMLATGRRLAATLNGQLVDAQGCQVSRQSASHMREDVINYLHSAKIAHDQEAHGEA